MVAVFNKDLLSWYLITLKLRETVESGIPRTSDSNGLLELPEQTTSESQKIEINDDGDEGSEDEWVISIKEKLEKAHQDDENGSWEKLSVYKVPQHLREVDDRAYIPQMVSLGPYHHGKRRLRQMDRHKWRSLHHVLKRTSKDIRVYLDAMKELEERARACYEGPISLSSKDFVEMLVLDGCFVLELFRGAAEGFDQLGYPRNDPIFAMRGSMHSIQRDMIMLENQLPLFILDRLLGLQIGHPQQKGLVAKLALRFFDPLTPTDEPLTKGDRSKLESSLGYTNTFDPLSDPGGLHCLDVFRRSLLRSGPQPVPPKAWIRRWSHANRVADKRRQQLIHCVTELRESGVKFRKRKTDKIREWDSEYSQAFHS